MQMKRMFALLLAFVLLLGVLPGAAFAATEEAVTLIAASDLQNAESEFANTQAILAQIKKDTADADAFLACGDYDIGYLDAAGTQSKLDTLTQTVVSSGVVSADAQMVYVQGNHDLEAGIGNGLANTGDNDPDSGEYGVFVLNYRDTGTLDAAKTNAELLRAYLNEKLKSSYAKPIFVLAHAPLHYSMRTYTHGEFPGAEYIFNVLNDAGEKGLNIFFLFGHNHSTWDHYLGGGAIYLPKGDNIMIATRDDTQAYQTHRLAFTYLNAGYIGYYSDGAVEGTDCTLTMTKLEISGSAVTITRYSAEGIHNLKSAGVNNHYREEFYAPNRSVYTSPQTVALTAVSDTEPMEAVTIRAASLSLSGVLGVNVKADLAGENPAQYCVEATVDGQTQQVSEYRAEHGQYVYTADLLVQDLHRDVHIALKKGTEVVDEQTFRYADYAQKLCQMYPKETALLNLTGTLRDYGTYAAYFADNAAALTQVPEVEAVSADDLAAYAPEFTLGAEGKALQPTLSLFLDTACDLRVKFDQAAFDGCTLTVNGETATTVTENGRVVWQVSELLPQQWGTAYDIQVTKAGDTLFQLNGSALSYVQMVVSAAREQQEGLKGLAKAMYRYSKAAVAYQTPQEPVYVQVSKTILDKTAASTVKEELPGDAAIANVYSGGYATAGIIGNVELSKYTELKFYVKTSDTDKYFELFAADGTRLLALHKQTWEEVKLVREGDTWALYLDNKWRADGLPGDTLDTLFSKVTLGGSAEADVYVTDLVGIDPTYIPPETPPEEETPVELVYVPVSGQPFNLTGTASQETPPEGYESVTALTTSWNKYNFNSFDLSQYPKVKFAVKSTVYYGLMNGDTVIHETKNGGNWLEIELVKNGDAWDVYYGGTFEQSVTLPNNNLTDLYFRFGTGTFHVTELQGAVPEDQVPLEYETVSDQPFALTGTASQETPPEGYESVTALTTSWNKYSFNNFELAPYQRVKFAVKSSGYYCVLDGGLSGGEIDETNGGGSWLEIELVKNGASWDLYYNDTLKKTLTLPNNNLTDISFKFGTNTYHVTELKGMVDPDYVYVSPYEQVKANLLAKTPTSTTTENLPSADVSRISIFNCGWVSPGLTDGIFMENYTELKFYYKVSDTNKWFEMYGQGGTTLLQGHATAWTEVKFVLEGEVWTLYVDGQWKASSLTGATLKDIVPTLTLGGSVTADVYVTDLIGKPV